VRGGFAPTDDTTFAVRRGGTAPFRALGLSVTEALASGTSGTLRLRAVVPDSLVTERGLDYYLALSGGPDTLTAPAGGLPAARTRPAHLPIGFESLEAPYTLAPETYRMVSIPAVPDGGIKAALTDAYGPYDATEWRLERWDATADGQGGYRSFPALDTLRPGDGFWLVREEQEALRIGPGKTPPADTARRVRLASGWNQVGTPFGYAVPWDTVRAASGLTATQVDGPVAFQPGDAPGEGTYQSGQTRLAPWTAYFVFNAQPTPDTLVIPSVGVEEAGGPTANEGGDRPVATGPLPGTPTTAKGETATGASADAYTLRVEALTDDGGARTTLALRAGAAPGRDRYDVAQPPRVRPALRLSALVPDAGRSVPHAASARPLMGPAASDEGGRGQHWTLRLQNPSEASRTAKLRLQADGSLPEGVRRWVLDLDRNRRIAPGAVLSLEKKETRRLKVILGTEAYARSKSEGISLESLETTLRGSYPNPFAERATIEYVVDEPQTVTIEIYNVLGQKVRTLVDGRREAGAHRVTWEGKNPYGTRVGSGVYFYRLTAGDVTETRKMMLVR
jgi:hypothetical protein